MPLAFMQENFVVILENVCLFTIGGRGVPHLRVWWWGGRLPHSRSDGGRREYPIPGLDGGGGYPGTPLGQVWMVGGVPRVPPNQVWMVWGKGLPGYPPGQVWMVGVPWVPPWPGLDGGGYPLARSGWGASTMTGWGNPPPWLDGVPPQWLDGVPPTWLDGVPPPPPSKSSTCYTRRAVCLLRSRRRTFLFKVIISDNWHQRVSVPKYYKYLYLNFSVLRLNLKSKQSFPAYHFMRDKVYACIRQLRKRTVKNFCQRRHQAKMVQILMNQRATQFWWLVPRLTWSTLIVTGNKDAT